MDEEHPLVEVVHQMEDMDSDEPDIQELHPSVQTQDYEMKGAISSTTASESHERKGSYTWRIPNFLNCNKDKLYSECFEIGTYIWRLLTFPKGRDGCLAIYLDAPEASSTPSNLSPSAAFKLIIVNQMDPSKSFSKETSHTFDARETDWGFTNFISMAELLTPNSPYINPSDGTVELRVEIQVQPDPRYAYDSRKETGYVGLKNQGATCYMNSLVQYLFMLPYFRKAVYHMPTSDSDDPKRNMPLALQRLFFKLQYSKTSVSTKDLTASFGWSTYDAFLQHDAHELNRVLCEKLEDKMKGTKVERTNQELFEGQILNYLKCLHVDYTSERKESYMDLQLNVRGCKGVYDSFYKYIEEEMMDGANQYNAEGHGLQDAKKGVLFDSFPPVLQLHLKRFEYDFQRDVSTKVNDRYEFYEELDLDVDDGRFLSPKADRSVRNLYKLFAVLVHQGNSGGGHYYAYMRPDGKTWYKFDDERVTLEDEKAAMEGQFGGEEDVPGMGFQHLRRAAPSNAYMLVYVRVSDWDRVFCPVGKEDLNVHLLRRLEQELAEKEKKQKEKMEAHMYITVKVATDADIQKQLNSGTKAFDLVDHDLLAPERSFLRLRKHTNFSEVKRLMAERTGVPPEKQRYWAWGPRPNNTLRAVRTLTPEEETSKLLDLKDLREMSNTTKHVSMDIRLYLELPGHLGKVDPEASLYNKTERDLLIFLKAYYPEEEKIKYLGKKLVPMGTSVQELLEVLQKKFKLLGFGPQEEGPLEAWEEVKWSPTVVVEPCNPVDQLGMRYNDNYMDGDIFIVQRSLDKAEAEKLKRPNVCDYFNYIRNRRLVNFRQLSDPKEEGFTLELWQDFPYSEVTLAVARKLGMQPPEEGAVRIRLTTYNIYVHGPQRHPIKLHEHSRLTTMLPTQSSGSQQRLPGGAAATDILYYEILDMPLEQLEQLKTFKVYFHKESTEQASEHTVRVQREGTVADVLEQLAQQLGPAAQQRALRLMEVHSSKLYKIMEPSDPIINLDGTYWRLRAEFVPQDELSMQEGERLLHCYHISKKTLGVGADGTAQQPADQQQQGAGMEQGGHQVPVQHYLFGDPFVLKVGAAETLGSLKQRIKAKLRVNDEEFGQWRFWIWSPRVGYEVLSNDEEDVAAKLPKEEGTGFTDTPYLGMEHRDDKPFKQRQSQYPSYQRPIKINS
uniref:ubiquitinyl hydrolase 1 n=1 Tax=Dunaliella tertiolecta TaxID=3047 RepID=A0A7S3QRP1_DUNTE|mmetsp:Transcript_6894/g.18498  ORF Transcript_6894/g.18498 Transcript_6894/m.18498 type:complete len:1176 (-) Transcript_6894:322-3849(-)